ncbi:WavE lipopolysaccharide synthesis family protein [Aeromonas veronii]
MIKNSELSFVVQGSVGDPKIVNKCLNSIRLHFPGSIIILSTWVSSNLDEIFEYDELVLSDDPGFFWLNKEKNISNNLNRQIVSTRNGLDVVQTKYSVKVRADSFFFNDTLLSVYSSYVDHDDRILTITSTSRNPRRRYKMAYHICDFVYMSQTVNLRGMFSCALMSESDAYWFDDHEIPSHAPSSSILHRLSAEQYLWISFLRFKNQKVLINSAYEFDTNILKHSEKMISDYAIITKAQKVGIYNQKHKNIDLHGYDNYTDNEFIMLHKNKGMLPDSIFVRSLDFDLILLGVINITYPTIKFIFGFTFPLCVSALNKARDFKIRMMRS